MIVYILSLVGIAMCIFILWIIYTAHRAEERERQAFVDMWDSKRCDNEGYCRYLIRKYEREYKEMTENVKKDE